MPAVIDGLQTTSDKIRALLRAGYPRTETAAFLNIRYQHVRKVAVDAGIEGGLQRGIVVLPRSKAVHKVREDVAVDILVAAGFAKIAAWIADDVGGITLSTPVPKDAGVYAFVVAGFVKYIGLTRSGFRSRMSNYRAGQAGQRTSARVNQIISDQIAAGASVEIYVATPPPLEWNGLPVITAAGLEAGLIKMIQPPWNKMGVDPLPTVRQVG
ncbi:GIY-YIG nuclease family protein [Aminobacter aminovorans]|uniref:GIY-YIG nuclease family protein n=1 Tax=Aminobacter aminovorans TaxID=83263 RepID=UPI0028565E4D|nr:GIY-YIG nuclease family protein [Aminobacter aminovorans]MDR7221663.1 hypothetical protein [Aminobacter aminovorans]